MSILIKGMEMPKHGIVLNIHPDGRVSEHFDEFQEEIATAVELPPHGRLIDAKTLENMHFTENMFDNESKLFVPFVEVASAVFNAPTVIEAEGADDV